MTDTTVRELLVDTFGSSALKIEGINHSLIGGQLTDGAHFVLNDLGQMFVSCGGDVIVAFPVQGRTTRAVNLVRKNDNTLHLVVSA